MKVTSGATVDYQTVVLCGTTVNRPSDVSPSQWIEQWEELLEHNTYAHERGFDEGYQCAKEEVSDKSKKEGYTEAIYDAVDMVEKYFDKDEHKLILELTRLLKSLI